MTLNRQTLDDQLRGAHARNDGVALVDLYTLAAGQSEEAGDIDAACFYLTQAFVFALLCGSATADDLQLQLWRHGREVRPDSAKSPG